MILQQIRAEIRQSRHFLSSTLKNPSFYPQHCVRWCHMKESGSLSLLQRTVQHHVVVSFFLIVSLCISLSVNKLCLCRSHKFQPVLTKTRDTFCQAARNSSKAYSLKSQTVHFTFLFMHMLNKQDTSCQWDSFLNAYLASDRARLAISLLLPVFILSLTQRHTVAHSGIDIITLSKGPKKY